MIAGPNVPVFTMRRAVAYTIAALAAAGEVDLDRSKEDRKSFDGERAKLEPIAATLQASERALEDFDLGKGMVNQVRVELGDAVLDRGIRDANARTKLELRGKPGLGADHVFGGNVATLTNARLRSEPSLVIAAAARMHDLPDFAQRDAISRDLVTRANRQETLLADRDESDLERGKLESTSVRAVADAAEALARTKAALDARFPRQRDYVASFFLDVSSRRSRVEPEVPVVPTPVTPVTPA